MWMCGHGVNHKCTRIIWFCLILYYATVVFIFLWKRKQKTSMNMIPARKSSIWRLFFFFYFCFFMLLFPLFILLWSILSCCSVLRLYRTLINIQKLSEKSEITTYLCEKQHETLCCWFLSNSTSHLPWMYAHNIAKFAVLSSKSTV